MHSELYPNGVNYSTFLPGNAVLFSYNSNIILMLKLGVLADLHTCGEEQNSLNLAVCGQNNNSMVSIKTQALAHTS